MSTKRDGIIVEVISCLFIILFLYTGIMKLITYDTFKFDIWRMPFARAVTPIMAIAVPIIEIAVSASLMHPRTRKMGLYSSFILMVIFTLYVGLLLSTTKHLPCTCGGVIREMSWSQHLWFNIFFSLLGIIGINRYTKLNRSTFRKTNVALSVKHT